MINSTDSSMGGAHELSGVIKDETPKNATLEGHVNSSDQEALTDNSD